MKNIDNPIITTFKAPFGDLTYARKVAHVCRNEPWNAKDYQGFINHAVRWAVRQDHTFDLVSILLPHSDQAHDCRTLFKDACAHGNVDVVRLLIDHVDGDILRHNDGHAILVAAKNGNPEILQILKDNIIGVSLPIDLLFKKAVGVRGPALRSLDYLFPLVIPNIHHGLLYAAAGNNNLDNLQFLVEKMSSNIKPSYHSVLKTKLKSAAQTAVTQGFEECLTLLMDAHQSWFNKEIDYIGLSTYALQFQQAKVLLLLAQRSEDVQNVVKHAATHSNDECIQIVLAWMQNKRLTEETQNVSTIHNKSRKL